MQSYENLPIPTPGPQQARQIQISSNWIERTRGNGRWLGTIKKGNWSAFEHC